MYYVSNKETILPRVRRYYADNQAQILEKTRVRAEKNPEITLMTVAKVRSKRFGVPFSLDIEDVSIPDTCPILGLVLSKKGDVRTENSPSIDRVNPELGYVRGNTAIISDRANRIKNNGTADEHRKIADWMRKGNPIDLTDLLEFEKWYLGTFIQHAKRRSRGKNIEVSIRKEDIAIPRKCPVLGICLSKGKGKLHDASPTLDRFDPSMGYTKENVAIISYRANRIKNNGTAEEHLLIADWMDKMLLGKVA